MRILISLANVELLLIISVNSIADKQETAIIQGNIALSGYIMARIRVNPQILQQSANKIETAAGSLRKTGNAVWRSASSAPSYDGQFGPKVRAIGQSALAQAQHYANYVDGLAASLMKRAAAFQAADTMGAKRITASWPNFGCLDGNGFSGIEWAAKTWAQICRLINLGLLGSPVGGSGGGSWGGSRLPVGFIQEKYADLGDYTRLVNQLWDFEKSPEGREMAQAAMAANLLFVVKDKNGNELARWGKPDGKSIPMTFGTLINDSWGTYFTSSKSIVLNERYIDKDRLYKHTLIHEMQHAIDYNTVFSADEVEKASKPIEDMTIKEIETLWAEEITKAVKSEVNAHDVGYSLEGGWREMIYGARLDRSDGNYTKEEYDLIIYHRDYKEIYEEDINSHLKNFFPDNTSYRADVWVDENGIIQVDIDQSRPFVQKVINNLRAGRFINLCD